MRRGFLTVRKAPIYQEKLFCPSSFSWYKTLTRLLQSHPEPSLVSGSQATTFTCLIKTHLVHRVSLVAQTVKRLPAMQETWVQSLGREHALEEEMATHSSTLDWKIPWTEEPGRLQSMGFTKSQTFSLEKEMATHSRILAWRILWTEEPSGLQSMGSQRVGHDWAT